MLPEPSTYVGNSAVKVPSLLSGTHSLGVSTVCENERLEDRIVSCISPNEDLALDAAYHTVVNWHCSGVCFFVGPVARMDLKSIVAQAIVELRNLVRLEGIVVLRKLAQF